MYYVKLITPKKIKFNQKKNKIICIDVIIKSKYFDGCYFPMFVVNFFPILIKISLGALKCVF
jgi:hypothetical protein